MSDLQIRKATRTHVRVIISLYSESGTGKTYSALLLARGFAGPSGKVVIIDTESGRAELYADVPEFGSYEVLPLMEPFSPSRYIEAMTLVEQSGAEIGIMDSGSHEWEGAHGVLDMADENRDKSGKDGLHNWRKPKLEHALFIQKLMRSPIPWIVCLRAKYKTRQVKDNGKTVIVRDETVSPIQAEDFIFEATTHGWLDGNHNLHQTKPSPLSRCLPNNSPITLEHGRLLAEWCIAGASPRVESPPTTAKAKPTAAKARLWKLTQSRHGNDPAKLQAWLSEEGYISDGKQLSDLTDGQMDAISSHLEKEMVV